MDTQRRHERYATGVQTVLLFNRVIPVSKGDHIVGTLECKRNASNPRSLDIELTYALEALTKTDSAVAEHELRPAPVAATWSPRPCREEEAPCSGAGSCADDANG